MAYSPQCRIQTQTWYTILTTMPKYGIFTTMPKYGILTTMPKYGILTTMPKYGKLATRPKLHVSVMWHTHHNAEIWHARHNAEIICERDMTYSQQCRTQEQAWYTILTTMTKYGILTTCTMPKYGILTTIPKLHVSVTWHAHHNAEFKCKHDIPYTPPQCRNIACSPRCLNYTWASTGILARMPT